MSVIGNSNEMAPTAPLDLRDFKARHGGGGRLGVMGATGLQGLQGPRGLGLVGYAAGYVNATR